MNKQPKLNLLPASFIIGDNKMVDSKSKSNSNSKSIIRVSGKADYDKYVDLVNQREQYKIRLLSQYGFDPNTGGFNTPESLEFNDDDDEDVAETKLSQIEAIGEDIEEWRKRSDALFEYLEYLVKKYSDDGVLMKMSLIEYCPNLIKKWVCLKCYKHD